MYGRPSASQQGSGEERAGGGAPDDRHTPPPCPLFAPRPAHRGHKRTSRHPISDGTASPAQTPDQHRDLRPRHAVGSGAPLRGGAARRQGSGAAGHGRCEPRHGAGGYQGLQRARAGGGEHVLQQGTGPSGRTRRRGGPRAGQGAAASARRAANSAPRAAPPLAALAPLAPRRAPAAARRGPAAAAALPPPARPTRHRPPSPRPTPVRRRTSGCCARS
jgi:hypothetical protein